MNLEKAKQEFIKYTSNYDLKNEKIELKYGHSFRVMEKAGKIAESLKLSEEEIELSKLIGLLHDIGRFEQIRIYDSYNDHENIDHGDLGVQILQESNYIRKYIEDDKYDHIILKAIKNHNKFAIEDGLNEDELLFSKIVRDADKWDIFYEGVEMFWLTEEERKKVEKDTVSSKVYEQFKNRILIDRKDIITAVDDVISFIALVFDINFEYTFKQIKEADYIDIILDKFKFEDEETAKIMEEVRNI